MIQEENAMSCDVKHDQLLKKTTFLFNKNGLVASLSRFLVRASSCRHFMEIMTEPLYNNP
jgi:hypothetical protein